MRLQISESLGLERLSLSLRPRIAPQRPNLLPLIQTASLSRKTKQKQKHLAKQDPYRWAQIRQRKAAAVKRQDELKSERDAALGDPVRGITTPFILSFDTAGQASQSSSQQTGGTAAAASENPSGATPTSRDVLNYSLTKPELEEAISHAYHLSKPVPPADRQIGDPEIEAQERREHEEHHARSVEALRRITTLQNGNGRARQRVNIKRVIDTFGRHVTDTTLERPTKPLARGQEDVPRPVRGGPDTGSSEVQIGILTAKIRILANDLQGRRGNKDKANKRNLRLLVHKRQKLLAYMERKERGSGRWLHLIETLGLTPATWKNEISL